MHAIHCRDHLNTEGNKDNRFGGVTPYNGKKLEREKTGTLLSSQTYWASGAASMLCCMLRNVAGDV